MEILENKSQNQDKTFSTSKLTLVDRKELSLSGVEKVYESNENKLQVRVSGSNMVVLGSQLNIAKLDVEAGLIELSGIINEIKYFSGENKGNFFKRIFK